VIGVYEEFERELACWARRYRGDARREILRLCLLALEREQIVTVAYREELIARRLAAMPIPDEARELFRLALAWTWKDEAMHAVYVRGVLLRLGRLPLRLLAFAHQLGGALGGWSSSVAQHVRWADAPLSRLLAGAVVAAGRLAGKVPRAVRRELRYAPFRDFCRYNVEAERTAARCWGRLAELAATAPFPVPVEVFRGVREDEERHGRLFALIGSALDEEDRLLPGVTPDGLAREIGAIGEAFLPRARRRALAGHPLGAGGRVVVLRGTGDGDRLSLFARLLDEAGLDACLERCAARAGKPVPRLRVAVKAAFMFGYDRRDLSPVVDPALLEALARRLRERHGCEDVAVVEGRNVYDRFFRNRSVREVARYLGIASDAYRVVDLTEEQVPHRYARGMGQYSIGRTWRDADARVSFGKLRSNPVEVATLAVANLESLASRSDEFFFVERQAHRETALMMTLDDFPPDFAILDAYDPVADGLLGMMGAARPRRPGRLYAGADALAVDMVALRHLGSEPHASPIIREACHWFGDPGGRVEVRGVDAPIAGWRGPRTNDLWALLSLLAYPVYQFGSGRGAVFVPEMDEAAFPPVAPPGLLVRTGRRAVRALFGLRLPR
jgi:uncharacterized protein (DUF362 family)